MQPDNGGMVMVNFYPQYINCSPNASLSQVAGMYMRSSLEPSRPSKRKKAGTAGFEAICVALCMLRTLRT